MAEIGGRLQEERERLGLSQTAFGAIGKASKRAQIRYESGERSPDANYLSLLTGGGVDVLYVLTGKRASSSSGGYVDVNVLRQVIEGVEEVLVAGKLQVDAAHKANSIVFLYEHFKREGGVEAKVVRKHLQLVASR